MADITKANEQIATWDKNLERLKNGEFGAYKNSEESIETLLRYWKAQAEAGYPSASDNVRYFEQLIEKNKLNREQIIKAWECCICGKDKCFECPYCREKYFCDREEFKKDTFLFIKELTEENGNLGDTIACLKIELETEQADTVRKMRALIEKESSWFVTKSNGIVMNRTYQLTEDALDQIVKEILEGKK